LLKRKILGMPLLAFIFVLVLAILTIIGLFIGPILGSFVPNFGPSWLHVETPKPELKPGVLFNIGSLPVTNTMITAWITIVILVILTWLAFRKPKMVPAGVQKFMEFVYNSLLNFCTGIAGEKDGRRFFPFVATIFLFVLTNAYLGLLPFFGDSLYIARVVDGATEHVPLLRAANTDINVPLALALFAWIAIETFGIRAHGFFNYMQKFINTRRLGKGLKSVFTGKAKSALGDLLFGGIDIFVGFLELISEFIRIVSFTFRLFGNMTAGEVLILIVAFLAPLVLGVAVYGLETLIGFVQALIFGGLTLVWMTTAVAAHESEEEHH
jgi:F-type H+-transporting ATPase subunit a